jgi:hypothetical protein
MFWHYVQFLKVELVYLLTRKFETCYILAIKALTVLTEYGIKSVPKKLRSSQSHTH